MGLCPHELFNNTKFQILKQKMDLGTCQKIHNPALKADFVEASKKRDYGYDIDQMEYLKSFINDCDRKIQIAKKRLEDTQDEWDDSEEARAVHDFAEQIGKKLAKAEELGAEGNVEDSMALMKEVDELKIQKRQAEEIYRSKLPPTSIQQQKLRVCEVCAAYLSLYDNDRRLADHFGGKLHMGFIKIRDRLKELQEEVAKKREAKEKERIQRREEREKERRERERKYKEGGDRDRRDRDRNRGRDRERSRERRRNGERHRDRDRERSRNNRSRSRESRRRSRSRDRKPRPHSTSRSRTRSKSRSGSRSRRGGPRSRSMSRSRSRSHSKSRSEIKKREIDATEERNERLSK
ncbi:putative RNA-binding protein Luc7-like 2 isoform X2 [Actinia tenebrosa]|nr:putative RNA-binding protein Luc7-like 2 isoform X2 [Actinia tenebrosa]